MACLICSSESYFIKKCNNYEIEKCAECGVEFTNPMPTQEQLAAFYSQYYDLRAKPAVTKRNAVRNLDHLQNYCPIDSNSSILDFGCGANIFVGVCRELGFPNSWGYDQFPKGQSNQFISYNFMRKNKWDLITLWGVLEHVTDPLALLSMLRSMLSPKGVLILTTILIESKIPYQHKPPEHIFYFSSKSIEELAKKTKFLILMKGDYVMEQDADIYLSILLRTMPDEYKKLVSHRLPEFVEIPTNEVLLILKPLQS